MPADSGAIPPSHLYSADSTTAERLRGLRDGARGAMLGLALGDALGATVEFMTPREISAQFGRHDSIRGGGWLRLRPGQVTDDTTMAFSLAQAILDQDDLPAAGDYANAFDAWMRQKPVDIGNTVRRGISRFRRTGEAIVPPSEDAGNGATMRCAPTAIGLLGASADVVANATLAQARVTHNNLLTDTATITVVKMVQSGILGQGIRAVMQHAHALVKKCPEFRFRPRQCTNPSGYIVDTMRVVLQGFDLCDSFESIMTEVVNRGGDADTTGAIAGMIAGALYGEARLPHRWLRSLNAEARTQCILYADALIQKSPAWRMINTENANFL